MVQCRLHIPKAQLSFYMSELTLKRGGEPLKNKKKLVHKLSFTTAAFDGSYYKILCKACEEVSRDLWLDLALVCKKK